MVVRAGGSLPFQGALVKKAADQTAANYTAATAVAWDAEEYDTAAFHDNSTNNTRLTIPAGIGRVQLSGQIAVAALAIDTWVTAYITKNGVSFVGQAGQMLESGATTGRINVTTPALTVVGGDYFEVVLQTESDISIDITAAQSWFAIEVVY